MEQLERKSGRPRVSWRSEVCGKKGDTKRGFGWISLGASVPIWVSADVSSIVAIRP